ncbi:hypothetical protein BD408DRAFT_413658 [Parasitella parasitica]|nr:hypothetical protein BD408DRAFT_413658 [Parasitella parasitica]
MGCSFFPEYPLELANLIDDDRTAARALHDETHPNPPVDTFKDNQKIEEFLTQMERTIDQKIKNVNNNNNNNNINNNNDICKTVHSELLSNNSVPSRIPPFPQQQHHRKQSIKKETSRKPIPAVHISKADFMSTEALAATTALQKKRSSLHDDDDNPEYGASFSDYIIGTSTPIKTNRHLPPVSSSKVLSDVDNQQEVGSSLYFNTRSRSRRSESTVNSSKKQGKTETAKPTFNLTRKRH